MGESLQNCAYLAVWCLDPVTQMAPQNVLLDVVVQDHSLSRGLPLTFPPPEQYFNPTAYNFGKSATERTAVLPKFFVSLFAQEITYYNISM